MVIFIGIVVVNIVNDSDNLNNIFDFLIIGLTSFLRAAT